MSQATVSRLVMPVYKWDQQSRSHTAKNEGSLHDILVTPSLCHPNELYGWLTARELILYYMQLHATFSFGFKEWHSIEDNISLTLPFAWSLAMYRDHFCSSIFSCVGVFNSVKSGKNSTVNFPSPGANPKIFLRGFRKHRVRGGGNVFAPGEGKSPVEFLPNFGHFFFLMRGKLLLQVKKLFLRRWN